MNELKICLGCECKIPFELLIPHLSKIGILNLCVEHTQAYAKTQK